MGFPLGVPEHSVIITFEYDDIKGRFYVWGVGADEKRNIPHNKWQWSALGNCGEEDSLEEAIDKARDYVRGLVT